MRIVFFGQSGPYSPWALKRLLDSELPCEIVAIVEGRRRPMGRQNHRWLKPKRVGRQPRLPVGESLSDLAVAAGIPVFQTCDVNARRVVDELDKLQLDLMVCAGFDSPGSVDSSPIRLLSLSFGVRRPSSGPCGRGVRA